MLIKIYTLCSTRDVSNIRYVGKTTDPLKKRLSGHLAEAKQKKAEGYTHNHKCNWVNKELSEGYNIVIEEVDSEEFDSPDQWQQLEQYWISQFKTWGFNLTNITLGGDGVLGCKRTEEARLKTSLSLIGHSVSEETKQKISKQLTGSTRTEDTKNKVRKAIVKLQGRSINQYDLEGNFIKTWEYIKKASIELNIDAANIGSCCNKKPNHYQAGGYIWRYIDDNSPIILKDIDYILQFDLNGKLLNKWKNMNQASKELDIASNAISRVCSGELKQTKGFVFIKQSEFTKDYKFPGSNCSGRVRKVEQYLNERLIQTFKNCTEAGIAIGGDRKKIAKCCKGEISSYKGFVFKYV